MSSGPTPAQTPPRGGGPRHFGRFALVRLLGRSMRTMAWHVSDPRTGQDLVLLLPRVVPAGEANADRWLQRARKAARLDHPRLAPALEVGLHEGWPYVTYELGERATLADRVGRQGLAADEAATLTGQLLHALAYAHDAGVAQRDLQAFSVLVSDKGVPRLMGLEVACIEGEAHEVTEAPSLQAQRQAAEADIVQVGVLMHLLLTGQPALDEPDTLKVAECLPPHGRDIVRLPFSTPRPIPEPLRVIVNRSTDRQERQRYRNARTMARALEGWLQVDGGNQGGPLALLLDKIRIAGVLPASPQGAERAARLALMERNRTDELAEVLLEDIALSFELLRAVNTARVGGEAVSDNGAVLTVRRAIAMMGLDGVRRIALALRPWPGPLPPPLADELSRAMERVRRAGRVAMVIRPAGYDPEVVYLITLMQNLGRLVVQYHFADEAAQVRRLMQPAPAAEGKGEDPGMTEQAAAMAVLGVDLEAIGTAVARWWGLDDGVVHMMRRHALTAPVRSADGDDDQLRMTASCANEVLDALALPAHRVQAALQTVVQRYGRALSLTLRDLQAALQPGAAETRRRAADAPVEPPPRGAAENRAPA